MSLANQHKYELLMSKTSSFDSLIEKECKKSIGANNLDQLRLSACCDWELRQCYRAEPEVIPMMKIGFIFEWFYCEIENLEKETYLRQIRVIPDQLSHSHSPIRVHVVR